MLTEAASGGSSCGAGEVNRRNRKVHGNFCFVSLRGLHECEVQEEVSFSMFLPFFGRLWLYRIFARRSPAFEFPLRTFFIGVRGPSDNSASTPFSVLRDRLCTRPVTDSVPTSLLQSFVKQLADFC